MRQIIFIVLFLLPFSLLAQDNIRQMDNPNFKRGLELLSKEKYGSAAIFFDEYLQENKKINSSNYIASRFYRALCDLKMKRINSKNLMLEFITDYPNSIFVPRAKKLIAYLNFNSEDYIGSLDYFEGVNISTLDGNDKAEFLLKRAYCYMVNNQLEEASNDFYMIDPENRKYKPYANFYYANIAFKEGNYQTALSLLKNLQDYSDFEKIVPYYIIQIYYMQKDFDKLIEEGTNYYERVQGDRKYILARILANAYFNKDNFEIAERYYKVYYDSVEDAEKQDNYEYGYCLYKLGKYSEAVDVLIHVGGKDDILTQAASYCLSDCYLKLGNKQLAQKALLIAASFDFDAEIKESALFNKAKINYELSYSPFNETLNSFDDYIASYPDSRRNDEAYNYLVNVYMQTKDYEASLRSMDRIEVKTVKIKKAYQRIAYYRGMQNFNNGDYSGAIKSFELSLKYKDLNNVIAADCVFWIAESHYQQGEYNKAIEKFDSFLLTPGSSLTNNYAIAYYSLAYACFQIKDFEKAMNNFKSFELQEKDETSEYLYDARCRVVDYYLYKSEYENCITYCDKLISSGVAKVDYALLKKSMAFGLLGDVKKQLISLDEMITEFPRSEYYSEACYEAGNAAMTLEDNVTAMKFFNKVVEQNKSFKYDAMSELQLALIAFNEKNLSEAQKYYKSVISDYQGTDYAVAAKAGLKNVMVEINEVDNYYAYIKEKGMQTNVDNLAKDSLSFAAAERLYMDDELTQAIPALDKYISTNPSGDFFLTANYYLADSYFREKEEEKSLPYYEKVISIGDNTYTLDAAYHAAEINDKNNRYNKSIRQFAIVERLSEDNKDKIYAKWKMLEGCYRLERYQETVSNGEFLLNSKFDISSVKYDIQYKMAKSFDKLGDKENAMKYYSIVAKDMKRKEGAESKLYICKTLYDSQRFDDAEREINEFMESESTEYKSLAECFMLLADIFLKKDDKFQAKYTLMSIIENYPNDNDGVLNEANKRLALLKDKEDLKQDSVKQKNANKKTMVENEDFKNYRNKFDDSQKKESDEQDKKAEELLNEMENIEKK